jgi:leucyl aminopeptidase
MNVRLHPTEVRVHETPLLVLPVFEGEKAPSDFAASLDEAFGGAVARAFQAGDVRGRTGESLVFYRSEEKNAGPARMMLLGAGKGEKLDAEQVRRFLGRAVRGAERLGLARLTVRVEDPAGLGPELLAQAAAEGAALAAWSFRELKSSIARDEDAQPETPVEEVELSAQGDASALEAGIRAGRAIARGQNLARTLQSRPGNVATPSHLSEEASRVAAEVGLQVRALGLAELREERMNALLAVNQGSDQEPRLIVLEHRGGAAGEAPLALVGKGLTFDSGGISIKPSQGMDEMKHDMSGAATVVGILHACARLELPIPVVGVIGAAENLPSGTAYRPGDIVRAASGKTIEVLNTDAEGRVVLADALHYARSEYDPCAIVDLATLTGACVVALGQWGSGLFAGHAGLGDAIREAGEIAGECAWPMPLFDGHKREIKSEVADIKNTGGRSAGASTAAAFLSHFVGDTPWAISTSRARPGRPASRPPIRPAARRGWASGCSSRCCAAGTCRASPERCDSIPLLAAPGCSL